MGRRVLLVGAGAREHAVAWKLKQSRRLEELFVAPGNAGTAELGTNLSVQPKDVAGLVKAAGEHRVDFYLATMDDPQPLGLVDELSKRGVLCYGPTQAAARLESSKAWAKEFMVNHGVPTARHRSFSEAAEARDYVRSLPDGPMWVKADGLAAGKGAIGCRGQAEALEAIEMAMVRREFGAAGDVLVIEEDLRGWETSAHAFCDGTRAVMWPFATDYKRAQDGDHGLNTGGMGAYSPSLNVDAELSKSIEEYVVTATMEGMHRAGTPYCGTLFPGIIVTAAGMRVLEFNARSGDPETQVLLPRLESDLLEVCEAAAEGQLDRVQTRWSSRATVGVVLASGGYPATYKIGHPISGLDELDPDVLVFHAGTKREARGLVTNGGRVVTVVASGDTLAEARARAYANVERIHFSDVQYRRDIALQPAGVV